MDLIVRQSPIIASGRNRSSDAGKVSRITEIALDGVRYGLKLYSQLMKGSSEARKKGGFLLMTWVRSGGQVSSCLPPTAV
jgi:hypothetical protein